MKKSCLSGATRVLTLFAMVSSTNAAIITSDDTAITTGYSLHIHIVAVSPATLSDTVLALNAHGDSAKSRPDENFYSLIGDTLPVSRPHADSHLNIWLLLIVAVVAGSLSEIFQQRSSSR